MKKRKSSTPHFRVGVVRVRVLVLPVCCLLSFQIFDSIQEGFFSGIFHFRLNAMVFSAKFSNFGNLIFWVSWCFYFLIRDIELIREIRASCSVIKTPLWFIGETQCSRETERMVSVWSNELVLAEHRELQVCPKTLQEIRNYLDLIWITADFMLVLSMFVILLTCCSYLKEMGKIVSTTWKKMLGKNSYLIFMTTLWIIISTS